jgi:two-component system, NarL family, sensor histidine kinase UhpB
MSLRFRINLLITCLSVLFVAALAVVVVDNMRSSIREETDAATRVTVQMLRTFVLEAERAETGVIGRDARLEAFVKSLGRVRSNEIIVYSGSELAYNSPPSTYKAGRSAPDWFARLVGPRISVSEIRARGLRIVVIPDPSRSVLDAWDDIGAFAWLILGFFAVLNVLVYWFVGRALRPVNVVVDGLSHMEQGNFQARLPQFSLPELMTISDSFNRMAERLEQSLSENRELVREQEVGRLIRRHLETERKNIARELHDELGQCLTAIRTIAVSISNRTRESQPEIHGSAQTIASVAGHAYDEVYRIVHQLRPPALESSGLGEVLRDLAEAWKARHPGVAVNVEAGPGLERAGDAVSLAVFRVVQECLTNIAKHSGATQVEIRLAREGDAPGGSPRLELAVRDNGKGMDPATAAGTGRFGMLGMRERVEGLKGTFALDSTPGNGLCVRISLPMVDETDERGMPWQFV